jgi:hypothetical protein
MSRNRRRRNKKKKNDVGWTTVTYVKPRKEYEWKTIVVPPEIVESLSPLESAVHKLLLNAEQPLTAEYLADNCGERCTTSDIRHLVYHGRFSDYIETADPKQRPKHYRLGLIKVLKTEQAEQAEQPSKEQVEQVEQPSEQADQAEQPSEEQAEQAEQ